MTTTYLQDNFLDTNGTNLSAHTMLVGPGWTDAHGTWTIQSNTANPPADTDDSMELSDAGHADVTATTNVNVPNTSNYAIGIAVRSTDANNLWRCVVQRDGGTARLSIVSRVLSSQAEQASQDFVSPPHGTTITLTVVTLGDTITLSSSTGESCQYTSASDFNTITTHGLYAYTAFGYTGGNVGDNFLVTDGAAAGGAPFRMSPTMMANQMLGM